MGGTPASRSRKSASSYESISLNSDDGYKTRQRILEKRTKLSYPESQSEQNLGRIRFAVHKPVERGTGADKKVNSVPLSDRKFSSYKEFEIAAAAEQKAAATASADESINTGLTGVSYKLSDAPIVDMYIPLSLTYNDGVQYDNANLSLIGGGTLEGISGSEGIFQSAYNALVEGIGNAFDYAMNPNLSGEAARLGALRLSKGIPNAGFQAAVSIGVQRAFNPNTRAMFRGVNLRQFTFQFKMIANSPSEARTIEKIIEHFRTELYPEAINLGTTGVSSSYKFPNAFSIYFTHRNQEAKIPKLEYCFLRNVQTNYNPTGAAFHSDGQPNEIDMTLTFTEMRTLNKQDVLKGY